MDLGSLFSPQPQAASTPNPELKGEWDSWLSDPANKAGLLSFGLQAMSGGWGNGTQQLAAALGSGAEGYAGAQKIQIDKDLEERRNNEARGDKEAGRSLQRELNDADNTAAMDRLNVTNASREKLLSQRLGGNGGYSKKAQDLYNKTYVETLKDVVTTAGLEPEEAEILAQGRAARAAENFDRQFNGNKTSEISGDSTAPVGTPPGANTPATEPPSGGVMKGGTNESKASTPINRGTALMSGKKDITPFLIDPRVKQAWETNPAYRMKMMSQGWQQLGK